MSFNTDVNQKFPDVQWHGGSSIHVSVCGGGILNVPFSERATILYLLDDKHVADAIYRQMMHKFGHMEWLIEQSTFSKLFLVDMDRQLQGQATSESPNRIKNPATGNLFHRVALLDEFIGGIRFWAEEFGGGTNIGYRFRIVKQVKKGEDEDVREEARRREEIVAVDYAETYETIMEVSEPPKEMAEATNKLVQLIEGAQHAYED